MKTFKISFSFNKEELTKINLRPFWVGLFAGCLMTFLSYFGIPEKLVSPVPNDFNIMNIITPKLNERKNSYKLQREASFIGQVHGSSSYDMASAYVVVDFDSGKIVAEKDAAHQLPIASITKVMTSVVALDLARADDLITITKTASEAIPTKIGVIPGQRMTLYELLQATLLTSANDAAGAIKDGIDAQYGAPVFMKATNKKAELIGLKNTHFANPQGFDDVENYSTAEDLAILSHYALTHYPLIAEIVKKDSAFLPADANHRQFELYNWNGLIDVYPHTFGIKIGNTRQAAKTTVVGAQREDKKMLVVLLGAPDVLKRDMWAAQLLDLGFETEYDMKPVNVTEDKLRAKYATWVPLY